MVDFLTRLFTIENVGYLDQRYEVLFKMIEYLGKAEQLDVNYGFISDFEQYCCLCK